MINILQDRCTHCGICVNICHESCLSIQNDRLVVDQAVCSTCTQCVSICPQAAITWAGNMSTPYDPEFLPDNRQIDELLKERRSIRRFKPQKVERDMLSEIINAGAYAPTHNFCFRVICVDDAEKIATLDDILLDFCRKIYGTVYKIPGVFGLAKLFGYGDEMLKAKPKLEESIESGHGIYNIPPAIVFIIGEKGLPLSEASAQFALANMMFSSQSRGLGTCLWGNGPIFMDKNRRARTLLGINRRERIYGAMFIGYPAIHFRNKVIGRVLPLTWI